MPANGIALHVGSIVPSSGAACAGVAAPPASASARPRGADSACTGMDDDPVLDAFQLPPGEDAARDELVGVGERPALDDATRHARRDAGQALDLPERGPGDVDGRGLLGRAL